MSDKNLYRLADSTVVEPLINNWAVWSDLVSPATYSLHLLNYQLKTLSSYVSNPEMHLKACRNPKFAGGPFVDIPVEHAGTVKEFLDRTQAEQAANIRLAKSLTEFYNLLNKEAHGQSLEPYYERLPEELRGYAELVYDYFHHPILRPLESLLYESDYYRRELQSLRLLEQKRDDSRPFFLSTPRLTCDGEIDWRVPFESAEVDKLFELEERPQPLGHIRELLGLSERDEARLLPLLSAEPLSSPYAESWDGEGVRISYFGHACVLIEFNGVSLLTDPWVGLQSTEKGLARLSFADLPRHIDYALITHNHHDHFVLETLLRLRRRIGCLVVPKASGLFYADPSLKLQAQKTGFRQVIELDAMESIKLPGGELFAIPFFGEHADLPHAKTGYLVRAAGQQILFAADSNCLDRRMYENVRRVLGPIKTVFLGMECVGAPLSWLYGALLPTKLERSLDQTRRTKGCDSEKAMELLEAVGSERVYVYAMGREPWFQYSMGLGLSEDSPQLKESERLLERARERGFREAVRPYGHYRTQLV